MSLDALKLALEFTTTDGRPLGRRPISPDWVPACECARFNAMRRGLTVGPDAVERVRPLFIAGDPRQAVCGALATVNTVEGEDAFCRVGLDYFQVEAHSNAQDFAQAGLVSQGETVNYRVVVDDAARDVADTFDKLLHELPTTPIQGVRSAASLRAGAQKAGAGDAGDFQVYMPNRIIVEAARIAKTTGTVEAGAVLTGHLFRDTPPSVAGVGDIYLYVTGIIPAHGAVCAAENITFTPETWSFVHDAVARRGLGETLVGWMHSHPARFWSSESSPVNGRFCSPTDMDFHRVAFPKPYHVALILGDARTEQGWQVFADLFGWRAGTIVNRGFWLCNDGAVSTD